MQQRQPKVLIADDASTVHELIRDALPTEYSANLIHAFDGVECLQALDHGVDLAFIDVHMRRWAAWMPCGQRELRETRLSSR